MTTENREQMTLPIHPCSTPALARAHEGWTYVIIQFLRCTVITLTILVITAYLVYLVYSDVQMKNLEDLETEIMVYRNDVEGLHRNERRISSEENGHLKECEQRVDAGRVDAGYIKRIVDEELIIFDMDKTGKMDFAIGGMGGSIVSSMPGTSDGSVDILGVAAVGKRGPEAILDPSVIPGDCWAFPGRKGSVVVRLMAKILVTDVALEHIPREIVPNGDIRSAPKIFSVVGLENLSDSKGHPYGIFVYSDKGATLQSFPVKNLGPPTEFVRFDFQENHGSSEYTCVYRVRVHGMRA